MVKPLYPKVFQTWRELRNGDRIEIKIKMLRHRVTEAEDIRGGSGGVVGGGGVISGGGGGGVVGRRRRRPPFASLWRGTVRIQWGYSEDTVSYSAALRLCHPPLSLPPPPITFLRRRTPQTPLFGGIQ